MRSVKKKTPTTAKKKAKPAPKRKAPAKKPESPAVNESLDRSGPKSSARELSWPEFDRVVQQLARTLAKDFAPEAVIGVAHGGVFVGGALASALKCEFYPVRLSRRSRDQGVGAAPKLSGVMPRGIKGRRVVIADDIAATGDTLQLATRLAKDAGAKSVVTTALVCRPKGFAPDYHWVTSGSFFVFPWDYDLTTDARFRALM